MKIKRFLFYFGSTVIIGLILYLGLQYQGHLKKEFNDTFTFESYVIFKSAFPIFIGLLLRFPKLILEIKEKKQWTFDWVKVLVIGLPALYITTLPILAFNTSFGGELLFVYEVLYLGDAMIITVTGMIFGYVLMDSLKKDNRSSTDGQDSAKKNSLGNSCEGE